jgi:hypothetical protein
MKNLELKELGVQEMDTNEMINVNGGGLLDSLLGPLLLGLVPILNSVIEALKAILK